MWGQVMSVLRTFGSGVLVILFWAFAVVPTMFAFVRGIAWTDGAGVGAEFDAVWGGWGVLLIVIAGIQWFAVVLFLIYMVGRHIESRGF